MILFTCSDALVCPSAAARVFKYDLSLAPGEMYELVEETRRRLRDFPNSTVSPSSSGLQCDARHMRMLAGCKGMHSLSTCCAGVVRHAKVFVSTCRLLAMAISGMGTCT